MKNTRPPAHGLLLPLGRTAAPAPSSTLQARPAPATLARSACLRPAHPDALQHPDPLLFVHAEGHPAALAALNAPHRRKQAGRRPRDSAPQQRG